MLLEHTLERERLLLKRAQLIQQSARESDGRGGRRQEVGNVGSRGLTRRGFGVHAERGPPDPALGETSFAIDCVGVLGVITVFI